MAYPFLPVQVPQKKVKNTEDCVLGWDLLHGSHRLHFPKPACNQTEDIYTSIYIVCYAVYSKVEVAEKNLNQSWLHNLNAERSSSLVLCGLFVWKAKSMPIARWMAHGNAHHGKCLIVRKKNQNNKNKSPSRQQDIKKERS